MIPKIYILKIPNRVFSTCAFNVALNANPRTFRVSAGLIIPSSQRRAEEKYGCPSSSNRSRIGFLNCSSSSVVHYQRIFKLTCTAYLYFMHKLSKLMKNKPLRPFLLLNLV